MPIQSPYTSEPIPDLSLTQFFVQRVGARSSRPVFIDGPSGRAYDAPTLLGLAAAFAHTILQRGLGHQQRVLFLCPNLPEFAIAFHGVIAAGGVPALVNPLSTEKELQALLSEAKPRFAVTIPLFVPLLKRVDGSLPLIVIGEDSFAAMLAGPRTFPDVTIHPEDTAVMPFSSGTTGLPKGVLLTHRNLVAQCLSLSAVKDAPILQPDTNVLAVLPFFHIYGIIAFLTYGPMQGATLITMPRFDLEQFLKLARDYELPMLHIVPPILLALTKYAGDLNLPHLKGVLVGAAPLSPELAAAFTKRTGALVGQVYGMTEVTGASHLGSREPATNKPGAVGKLIGNAEAKIVATADGHEVGVNEPGEIWVRGPIVMRGYLDNPTATAETIDGDGWLHTGDIGYCDADGDFWLVDRVKELIKYKGLQVAPAQLEAVLLQHPAVADAAVYPQPDEAAGEIPKAAVVLRPGQDITAEALMAFVAELVSPQKRIRALRFVDQIPKSASGKILRRVLVAQDAQAPK